jgi:uncharacterized damage-inducible protein DinB
MTGEMWHGSAVGELLPRFTAAQATQHPVAGAHSAWELVLHMTAWADIVGQRLDGDTGAYPPEDVDWPTVPTPATAQAWTDAKARLLAAYEALAERVEGLPDERFAKKVDGQHYIAAVMLDGVVEHAAYHGGQLAMLHRALSA